MIDKIILLGEEYVIKLVSSEYIEKTTKGQMGFINYEKKEILIDKDKGVETQIDILLHELGHYFARYYNLENSETMAEALGKYIKLIIKSLTKSK
jgi:Zn-dependent peptidase ImmA (M78 family)